MAAFAASFTTGFDREEHRVGAGQPMTADANAYEAYREAEAGQHTAERQSPSALQQGGSFIRRTLSRKSNTSPSASSSDDNQQLAGSTAAPSRDEQQEILSEDALHGDSSNPRMYLTDEERKAQSHAAVNKLARQVSTLSLASGGVANLFDLEGEKNPKLDPTSPEFSARAYAQAVLKFAERDPNAVPNRQAGVLFRNLNVHGYGSGDDYQKTVANSPLMIGSYARRLLGQKGGEVKILRHFDGLIKAGEMCVVLGPPGSGCTTFLKTIAGETDGFSVDNDSYINYQGIAPKQMHKNFKGEVIYTAEVDVHFPQLTVGETLSFAAEARAPRKPLGGLTRKQYAAHARDVMMAVFGISHTVNTRVGNDFIRGVSGGERKRVSIAEAALSQSPLQCWDNSTRGLDSANAIEFCKTLRTGTDLLGQTALVAIYQSPQAAYDCFDKVLVLYEGRQIYFGPCTEARKFFMDMGFEPPERQTTPDFLTSLTSPKERTARKGWENRVPRTPDDFAAAWKSSETYKRLMGEIDAFDKQYPVGGEALQQFKASRKAQQSKGHRSKSPYTLSYTQQIGICMRRGFWRLKADPSLTITQLFGNVVMNLVISSVFYNLQPVTSSFFKRSSLLFFAILTNAFGAALEILTLYAQRPIIEKHARYALYHPSAEAWASMLVDLPYKIVNAILCNITLYFMANLRREPGAFFFYLLIAFTLQLCMSMIFRTIASASRTFTQAMTPTTVLMLGLVIFTGFALPVPYMRGWSRWINYLNPIAYGFEALMVNEFDGVNYVCDQFVPSGPGYVAAGNNFVCGAPTAVQGATTISGTTYISATYQYLPTHRWRNFGIIVGELVFFLFTYMFFAEIVSAKQSKGEVLVFRRGHKLTKTKGQDVEDVAAAGVLNEKAKHHQKGEKVTEDLHIQRQTAIFHWEDICYDIKIKSEERRILDHVDGWVKPGQLTALMGVSGAGKTTLLDVLATRVTMGVVSGDALVDGRPRDKSFQRKTGYVQQQDLHLETATVRESLNFSALLRQPAHIPKAEKLAYVEEVIRLLDMEDYADAVVGVPGEGLNVEQRKRLTIGVELAAKPQLLLFLDEPTSGLDSQTSWAIADLMEKLTKETGQAILCTIHQPSALLFSRFDRLLFLARGGKTVYFGEVGENSRILIDYFQRIGGRDCPPDANPAEWMLEVIGAAPGSHTDVDWFDAWRSSPEYQEVKKELANLRNERPKVSEPSTDPKDKATFRPFAASYPEQFSIVTKRIFQQYWRTPSYIWAKIFLVTAAGLFIGFSFFDSPLSQQGIQNQLFSIFMVFIIFSQLTQQIMPNFVVQRALYEARERPSKTYSWLAFIWANIIAELPWAILLGAVLYFTWYYPIGYYKNAIPTGEVHLRGAMMFLFCLEFLFFASTFAHMCIAAIDTAETAGNMGNLLFSLSLLFCGVLATPATFPGFWIFMYRVSPFTYLVAGMISTGLANTNVVCSDIEYVTFQPAGSQTCGAYMQNYISYAGGYLTNPGASADCQFCTLNETNAFLQSLNAPFSEAWRNFGILFGYIAFNIAATFFLYWLGRVPKKGSKTKKTKETKKPQKSVKN